MLGRRIVLALAAAALVAAAGVGAQEDDLSRHPGFVDFNPRGVLTEDDLEIRISVKSPLIQLVAAAARAGDPELADVVDKLKAVEVHVYAVDEERREAVRQDISRRARDLGKSGWTEAIAIRVRGARGSVLMRLQDAPPTPQGAPQAARPVGLAAMYLDDEGEAVFVNIVGEIDAAQIGRLAAKFNLDVLSEAVEERRRSGDPE
jgi:hypothetical protein